MLHFSAKHRSCMWSGCPRGRCFAKVVLIRMLAEKCVREGVANQKAVPEMGFSAGFLIKKGFSVWVPDAVPYHILDPVHSLLRRFAPVGRCGRLADTGGGSASTHGRWACRRGCARKAASAQDADHRGWTRPRCVLGDPAEGLSEDPGCVRVHHRTGEHGVYK